MKTVFSLVAALLLTTHVFAQDDAVKRPIQIGPNVMINVTRNTADYHVSGPEREWGIGSRVGVVGDIPINDDMSVVAGLDYYTLSFSDKNKAVDVTPAGGVDKDHLFPTGTLMRTQGTFNYLALTTMYRVSNFCIGFTFGLPLTSTIKNTFDPAYSLPRTFSAGTDAQYVLREDISPPSCWLAGFSPHG